MATGVPERALVAARTEETQMHRAHRFDKPINARALVPEMGPTRTPTPAILPVHKIPGNKRASPHAR
eukprot:11175744-Lingulodinium_polyedra.AAC.1